MGQWAQVPPLPLPPRTISRRMVRAKVLARRVFINVEDATRSSTRLSARAVSRRATRAFRELQSRSVDRVAGSFFASNVDTKFQMPCSAPVSGCISMPHFVA